MTGAICNHTVLHEVWHENEIIAAKLNAFWREKGVEANARVVTRRQEFLAGGIVNYPEIVSDLTGREGA